MMRWNYQSWISFGADLPPWCSAGRTPNEPLLRSSPQALTLRLLGEREGKLWMWPRCVVIVKLGKSCRSRILTCSAAFQFWSKGPPEQQLITQSIHSFCFSLNDARLALTSRQRMKERKGGKEGGGWCKWGRRRGGRAAAKRKLR